VLIVHRIVSSPVGASVRQKVVVRSATMSDAGCEAPQSNRVDKGTPYYNSKEFRV
jgi:hypothetical protein